jgi:hypothetical protein
MRIEGKANLAALHHVIHGYAWLVDAHRHQVNVG